jgi:mono/diheme cytochrome c family protein
VTEVPEHLLKRSQERRAALGLGGGEAADAPAAAPAAETSSTEVETAGAAPPAAPPPPPEEVAPPPPEPVAPHVEAALRRRRVPVWALPVLLSLPVWAWIYASTLEPPSLGESDPLAVGEGIYTSNCATCHGASGGGGVGPALSGGAVLEAFPDPADHIEWVELGSEGFLADGRSTYGANNTPIGGGMPGWHDTLSPEEIVAVVYYERTGLSGEEPHEELVTPEGELLVDGEPVVLEGGGGGGGH